MRSLTPVLLCTVLAPVFGCGQKPDPTIAPEPERVTPVVDPARTQADAKAEAVRRLQRIGQPFARLKLDDLVPVGTMAGDKNLGLSWRVALLPLLGEEQLYRQFKLDEPWDSEHNRKLIPKMPDVYASPGKDAGVGRTYIRTFCGPGAFIASLPAPNKGPSIRWSTYNLSDHCVMISPTFFTDGTCNTIFAAEAQEAVEWTNPNDLPFEPGEVGKRKSLPKLGGVFPGGFHAVTLCGEVHFFPDNLDEASIRALITTNADDDHGATVRNILQHPIPVTDPRK